jgi:hypothetical protein
MHAQRVFKKITGGVWLLTFLVVLIVTWFLLSSPYVQAGITPTPTSAPDTPTVEPTDTPVPDTPTPAPPPTNTPKPRKDKDDDDDDEAEAPPPPPTPTLEPTPTSTMAPVFLPETGASGMTQFVLAILGTLLLILLGVSLGRSSWLSPD